MADIIIGNVRGPQGAQGAQGAQGEPGAAATVNVGTVTTTVYGNPAQVTNSGTTSAAVLDFVIPQGAPGSEVTDVSSLTLDSITETAASFPVPAIGEVMSVVVGKIVKFFGDTVAALGNKLDKANVYNGLDQENSGYALDARKGKALNDTITALTALVDAQKPFYWASNQADLNVDVASAFEAGYRVMFGQHAANASNVPSAGSGGYCVTFIWYTNSYATQVCFEQGTLAIYMRKYSSGTWAAWQKMA